MAQNTNDSPTRLNEDDARQHYLATDAELPQQLVGSRMEREFYLDDVVSDLLISSHIPQSRS